MHNIAYVSTQGNPVEGGILVFLIIAAVVAGATRAGRSQVRKAARTVRKVGNTKVGPRSRR